MKHAVLLALLLIGAFIGWRLSTAEQKTDVLAFARRYIVPVLLIIALVAVFYALFVITPTTQII